MADQKQKQYTKDYIDGVLQGLKIAEIALSSGKITHEDIEQERQHWSSLPVIPPTEFEVKKVELIEKLKEAKALNKELKDVEVGADNAIQAIFRLKAVLNLQQ